MALTLTNTKLIFLRVFVRVEIICLYEKFHGEDTRGSTVPPEERKTPHGYDDVY